MKGRLISFAIAFLIGCGLLAALAAGVSRAAPAATVRYVAPGGACGGPTPCYATIQAAVDAAAAGDEVRVAAGVYAGVGVRNGMTQSVFLAKALTIAGGYTTGDWQTPDPAAYATVIQAQGLGRGLVISGTRATTTIRGLRFTAGDAGEGYFGGGVYAISATVVFSNNWVYGNAAGVGAGLYLEECPGAVLAHNRIYANAAAEEGGGVALWASNGTALRGNQVYSNTAGGLGGGASLMASDDLLLAGNAFYRNVSDGDGGGLAISAGMGITLEENQVYANHAEGSGGGVAGVGGVFTLARNRVYDNTAAGPGGGILLTGAFSSALTGNQVYGNTAGDCGGGVHLSAGAGALLDSNRIYDNAAFDGGGLCLIFNEGVRLTAGEVYANRAAGNGGGAFVSDIGPALDGNRVYSNTAAAAGGGLYLEMIVDGATLTANQVYSNTAGAEGGGIGAVAADALVLARNRIWGNVADGAGGGGLYLVNSADSVLINNVVNANRISGAAPGAGLALDYTPRLRMAHTTISGNHGGAGSALFVTDGRNDGSPPAASVSLTNTIFADAATGIHVTTGNRVDLNGVLWYATPITVTQGATATVTMARQFTGSPAFGPDGYHLTRLSAAIDRGLAAGVTDDVDGEPRPQGAGYDLGADEYAARRVYLPLLRR